MTPRRPTELVRASQACAEAWDKRDQFIESGDKVGIMAMNSACGILDAHYNTLYQEWQILGGTSDIDSLTFPAPFVDVLALTAMDDDTKRTQEEARY